ncbi:uncharacterized protein LOC135189132 [Pogoniulus pusillus]|uniref:uncharacterized protein LOC135189132 n=1 Tax=Pogoniulus pusillus TaxID=488313 RepID=UPI0030B95475
MPPRLPAAAASASSWVVIGARCCAGRRRLRAQQQQQQQRSQRGGGGGGFSCPVTLGSHDRERSTEAAARSPRRGGGEAASTGGGSSSSSSRSHPAPSRPSLPPPCAARAAPAGPSRPRRRRPPAEHPRPKASAPGGAGLGACSGRTAPLKALGCGGLCIPSAARRQPRAAPLLPASFHRLDCGITATRRSLLRAAAACRVRAVQRSPPFPRLLAGLAAVADASRRQHARCRRGRPALTLAGTGWLLLRGSRRLLRVLPAPSC